MERITRASYKKMYISQTFKIQLTQNRELIAPWRVSKWLDLSTPNLSFIDLILDKVSDLNLLECSRVH